MKHYLNLLWLSFLLISAGFDLSAQDTIYTGIKTKARQLIQVHNYENAMTFYRDLLNRFPKEPEYQYGTAVCLTKLNRDPEEAIYLLRLVNTSGYNPMSYYYLGLLLHRSYLFDDAIRAYSRFSLLGKPADIKALDVKRQIEMAKNGIEYTRICRHFRVMEMNNFSNDQLEQASEIHGSGKMVKKPVEFCSKYDLKEGYRPLMFLPVYTEMNDYVYTSGYEKNNKGFLQIYRVRKINHETWSKPELLNEVINTPYDDEYPYFDAKASILYFSSKGHSSMGGYDIFKSVYDWNTKSWSPPENLGFPINSPYDDYFYMTDEFSQTASFISNRNNGPGQFAVYKINVTQDTGSMRLATIDQIQDASRLRVEPVSMTTGPVSIPGSMVTRVDSIKGTRRFSRKDYNMTLSDALTIQLRSDSLGRIARDKRLMARETPDEELQKQLVTDIMRIEKESKKLQRMADQKFAEARKMKENETDLIPEDTVMVLTKELNGIRVFSYNTDTMPLEQETGVLSSGRLEIPVTAPDVHSLPRDEFRLIDRAFYSPSNPIPKGLSSPNGLVYRIQLGVFSKPRPDDAFGGISPICYEQINNASFLKYYAGLFYSLNGVTRALEQIKQIGFPDAFIVAFFNGRLIPTEKAKEIEFEGMRL